MAIKTSDENWLKQAVTHYMDKKTFTIIDDAKLGLDKEQLISGIAVMGYGYRSGHALWTQIFAILTGLGMSAAGLVLVALAIADPEPTSKLGILLAGGVVLLVSGGIGTFYALGHRFAVHLDQDGFTIKPE